LEIKTKIIEAIQNNKLVFFIGSGFSRSLGFPNWNELVREILLELSIEEPSYANMIDILNMRLFSEIEILEKIKHKKADVYRVLDRVIGIQLNDSEKLLLHKKLGKVSSKIITTNYDRALETATGFKKIQFDNTFHIANLPSHDNYILKIHGCIEDPQKCVLFAEDYQNLYEKDSAVIERLKTIIADQTIVFIGFSFTDPYVRREFEYINNVYKGLSEKHYIVTTDKTISQEYGLEPIFISDWDEGLSDFLKNLHEHKLAFQEVGVGNAMVANQYIKSDPIRIEKSKVAILIAAPIDTDVNFNFDKIINGFNRNALVIDLYYFSEENLRELEGYDYIFIFTKLIQNKIVIEDYYLKSKLVTLLYLEQNLAYQEGLKGLFVVTDKASKRSQENISIPLVNIWDVDINSLVFKIFRKGKIDEFQDSIIYNADKLVLHKVEKGNADIKVISRQGKSKLSESIDAKNLSSFIGRTTDLEDIVRKILETNEKILTIKGSGGIGKTTVVKKAALEMYNRGYFSDGVYFIDCEFIDNYKTFEYKITQCFGLDSSINFKEHIIQNNMKINSLIILDNFEPMLYTEHAQEVREIIDFICEYSTVVVTSREWIGFEYEQRHELRAFTSEEALELFQTFYKTSIKETDLKILKEDILEDLLNNNPLAIKIVARNLPKGKSLSILREELMTDFFNTIDTDYSDIFDGAVDRNIERSKSLYQSISYSFKKLTSKEKILFETLSLFPDGIHMHSFKTFFAKDQYKKDINKITDKEINGLENKSLIEINKGFIRLQSILGRYAEYQFANRTLNEKTWYYKRAYEFNYELLFFLYKHRNEDMNESLLIFDKNSENFLKSMHYISEVESEKAGKLDYISAVDNFFSSLEQRTNFYLALKKLKGQFTEIEYGELFLDILIISSMYYEGLFEESYIKLNSLLPMENLKNINLDTEFGKNLMMDAISVYKYKNAFEIIEYLLDVDFYKYNTKGLHDNLLFFIGHYNLLKLSVTRKAFYYFEMSYNLGELEVSELDEYINGLYPKQYLQILQANYLKAKLGHINKEQINKLVVTNPYTQGLKLIMQAFLETDEDKAGELYKSAISRLEHISYYQVEAIYFYVIYLKKINSANLTEWYNLGMALAQKYKYYFQMHQYNNLNLDVPLPYDEGIYEFPLKDNIMLYLREFNKRHKDKTF
jgi:NAD-dependent SIR2 family protein deacetylase